ncbi:MAG: D-alanyl-D-alanine carboxypeptidase/D-alanyl-D-alanine-endopeptidase [Paenisporosarcina sp.]
MILMLFFTVILFLPFADLKEEQTELAEVTVVSFDKYALLSSDINRILQDDRLNGTSIGISIRKASTGEVIYQHSGDTRLHPASNMKLLTGAAALDTLGEDYRFTTEVLSDGIIVDNVLQGNLYLKGKGDPTLLKEDFDLLAKNLKGKGIQEVNGNLIGDDTWYDQVRLSADITWNDEPYYYAAQVSALTASPNNDYDAGTVIIEAFPNKTVGKTAIVKMSPLTDVMKVINRSKTVAKGTSRDIRILRQHGTNNILVEGTIPVESHSTKEWIAVWEPSYYALDLFKKSLQENGIEFSSESSVELGKTPTSAVLLTSKGSMPLKELFIPFMKLSNNGIAEVLTKEMGKVVYGEGSWERGLQVMEEYSVRQGLNVGSMQIRDGSGMSYLNLIPPNEVSKLLYSVQKESWYSTFLNSLPIPGNSNRLVGGTMRKRVNIAGNVKAKTGHLTSVSTLSGYTQTKDGEPMIFSILINNNLDSMKKVEDSIVSAIANYKNQNNQ